MADNTGQLKPAWQAGTSGNPAGRRTMPPELLATLKDLCPEVITIWRDIARDPRAKTEARLRATENIMDRVYGRPAQDVNLGGQADNPIVSLRPLAGLSIEQVEVIERMLDEVRPEPDILT